MRLKTFPLRTLTNFGQKAWHAQPFSMTAIIAVSLSVFALSAYAQVDRDLVVSVVAGAVLAVTLFLGVLTAVLRLTLAGKLSARIIPENNPAISHANVLSGIELKISGVFPFYRLLVSREFSARGVELPIHAVFGKPPASKRFQLLETLRFPHRGVWHVNFIRLTIQDNFGLTRLSWRVPIHHDIEVSPPIIPIQPLPVVASSSRSGDTLTLTQERTGDPYDMKPYDPSDGINRVLWKTYARTGELFVRRPEPAVIPEGEVAAYLIAGKDDDYVAGAFLNYLTQLTASDITVLFGTDGAATRLKTNITQLVFQSPTEIRRVINQSVWSPTAGTGKNFAEFVAALKTETRLLQRVIVFAPESSSHHLNTHVLPVCANSLIELSIALVPKELDLNYSMQTRLNEKNGRANKSASRLLPKHLRTLLAPVLPKLQYGSSQTDKRDAQRLLSAQGVQVIVCENGEFGSAT